MVSGAHSDCEQPNRIRTDVRNNEYNQGNRFGDFRQLEAKVDSDTLQSDQLQEQPLEYAETDALPRKSEIAIDDGDVLFDVAMQWGAQPVRLTATRCLVLPDDAPTTSVHIVALHGSRVLVVCDRKGMFGFPGGRLEAGETREEAMTREVYEEACAHLCPDYTLFAVLKIACTAQIPGRSYPHPHTYMAMYAGSVRALDPTRRDPAGIITSRALFTREDCARNMMLHDRILLREGLMTLATMTPCKRLVRGFLTCDEAGLQTALCEMQVE